MMKRILLFLSVLCTFFSASAQEPSVKIEPEGEKLYMLGVGKLSLLDTYLSPEHYSGTALSLYYESTRQNKNPDLSHSWMSHGEFSNTHPRSGNSSELYAKYTFGFGMYGTLPYEIPYLSDVDVKVGAEAEAFVGGIYNTRNGNNPAQLHAGFDIAPTAKAKYDFSVLGLNLSINYKATIPLIGLQFSPAYGQSYYELFARGNYDHNICLTTPINALSMTQRLTLSIPFKGFKLHVGYLGDYRQARLNSLKYHNFTHSFVIGYSL